MKPSKFFKANIMMHLMIIYSLPLTQSATLITISFTQYAETCRQNNSGQGSVPCFINTAVLRRFPRKRVGQNSRHLLTLSSHKTGLSRLAISLCSVPFLNTLLYSVFPLHTLSKRNYILKSVRISPSAAHFEMPFCFLHEHAVCHSSIYTKANHFKTEKERKNVQKLQKNLFHYRCEAIPYDVHFLLFYLRDVL